MNTETRACDPTVPKIGAGLEPHAFPLVGRRQTVPELEACAGVERVAARNMLPISNRIDETTIGIFFMKYTCVFQNEARNPIA